MTPNEMMQLLEPVRPELSKRFRSIDIQPLQRIELLSGETTEEVVIRLIK